MAKKPQKKAAPGKPAKKSAPAKRSAPSKPVKKPAPAPAKRVAPAPAKKVVKAAPAISGGKKVVQEPAPVQKTSAKPQKTVQRPVSPVRQIDLLKPIRNRSNSKLYRLRQKFEKETRKGAADQLRKEIKREEKLRDQVSRKIHTLRETAFHFEDIRKDKAQKKSRMRRIEEKLEKLYENKAYGTKEFKQLNTEYMRLSEQVHAINTELGIETPPVAPSEDELDEYIDEVAEKLEREGGGWEPHPATPHTIWDASRLLDNVLSNGAYNTFIVDGFEYPSSDPSGIAFEASNFWRTVRDSKGGTPLVIVTVNPGEKGIKFDPYETA